MRYYEPGGAGADATNGRFKSVSTALALRVVWRCILYFVWRELRGFHQKKKNVYRSSFVQIKKIKTKKYRCAQRRQSIEKTPKIPTVSRTLPQDCAVGGSHNKSPWLENPNSPNCPFLAKNCHIFRAVTRQIGHFFICEKSNRGPDPVLERHG